MSISVEEFVRHAKDEECIVYVFPDGAPPHPLHRGLASECLTYIEQHQDTLPNCHLSTVREFKDFYDVRID